MVAGHLQQKNGSFYIVINYRDDNARRKTKWISTGLAVKGNKKKAENMLLEMRRNFKIETPTVTENYPAADQLFSDYLLYWLEIAKSTIALATYASYSQMTRGVIVPYFCVTGVSLNNLKAHHIQPASRSSKIPEQQLVM